jgi:glycosyltransferase involved in cell wall biosynthesis
MTEKKDLERQKWDELYGSLALTDESPETLQFNQEFLRKIQDLLPQGGKTLEAGCGAGWQSMALARSELFDVHLMDFSEKALEFARSNFQRFNLKANFLLGDATEPGEPAFDLVFNAGVLEHYTFSDQVKMVRAMASRSRKYVLVLIPNHQCYWYWLWRMQKSAQNLWTFGKEVPEADISRVFEAAGLNLVGHAFMGAAWTENFIIGMDGLNEEARQAILEIHHSGLVPASQVSYLLAALGRVDIAASEALPGWETPTEIPTTSLSELQSALVDATALNISLARKVEFLNSEKSAEILRRMGRFDTWLSEKDAQIAQLENQRLALRAQLAAWEAEVVAKTNNLGIKWTNLHYDLANKNNEIASKNNEIASKNDEIASKNNEIASKSNEIAGKNDEIANKNALIEEIHRSNAWKMVQLIWKTKVFLRRLRHLELVQPVSDPDVSVAENQDDLQVVLPLQPVSDPGMPVAENRDDLQAVLPPQPVSIPVIPVPENQNDLSSLLPLQPGSESVETQNDLPVVPPLPPEMDLLSTFAITTSQHADRRVVMITYSFFDFDGNNMFFGGAERYVVELGRIMRQMGYEPEIWQCGNSFWVRYYNDLKVIGLNTGGNIYLFKDIVNAYLPAVRLLIFSPFSLNTLHKSIPSIGIGHGIYWDQESYQGGVIPLEQTIAELKSSIESLDWMVSVDTNTINWVRATARASAFKFTYIPNFVDIHQFHPVEKDNQRVVVLYPRRLYNPRGFYLTIKILPELLERYPQLDFHFVGKADPTEDAIARQLVEQFPGRIKYYFLSMEYMQEAYHQADIAIIPTLHSEGTSLSCLEALASGNAVIATNVGGLPDLILHGHNGLLIEPTSEALKEALVTLIENADLRHRLGRNGREVAEAFTIERWAEKWRSVLTKYLPPLDPIPQTHPKQFMIFNDAPGIFWDGVKQRPHHLAYQFAANGIETYWLNPDGRRLDPACDLHILDKSDDLYLERPFFFVYYPYAYEQIQKYNHPIVIYDILDDISIHEDVEDDQVGKLAREYYELLLKEADIVLVSSRRLLEQVQPKRPDVIYIPNGVDLNHFNPEKVIPTHELDQFTRPVIGYQGAVATWFDAQLFAETARLRPQYDFVVIGPVSDPVVEQTLRSQPNIHLLGIILYEDLPSYVARFDVGTIPFVISPVTHAVRPLKLLEYMAMKKPAVSTPIAEIADWPGVLLAATPQEFAARLDEALQMGGVVGDPDQVAQFLRESTWTEVVRPLLKKIRPTIQ